MSKPLPERPSLEHLRQQAQDLLRAFKQGDLHAFERVKANLPAFQNDPGATIRLHDAQSVIAREYGQSSWPQLVKAVESQLASQAVLADAAKTLTLAALSDKLIAFKDALEKQPGLTRIDLPTALCYGEVDYVRSALPNIDVSRPLGPRDWLPLEYVCYSRAHHVFPERLQGLLDCAKLLLDSGADPNTSHDFQGAPLSVLYGACGESGHAGIARLLLERGAEPNDGESVYHAAEYDRREILQILKDHGADISGKHAHWGNTPLFFLMGYRSTDLNSGPALRGCSWLLENGADPNETSTQQEETPLHAAVRSGRGEDAIGLLLDHGADPKRPRLDGWTPVDLAAALGNGDALAAFEARGHAPELGPRAQALADISRGIVPTDLAVLEGMSDVEKNLPNKLAEFGNLPGLQAAFASGLNVLPQWDKGATPLHYASYCGRLEIVEYLLELGARADIIDEEFDAMPLGWAIHASAYNRNPDGRFPEIAAKLVLAGTPVNQVKADMQHPYIPADVKDAITEALESI